MEYLALTDPLRDGDVIMVDRRRCFRFSFGQDRWVRTTILLPYLKEGSPLYRKYRSVNADEARSLLQAKGKQLAELSRRASGAVSREEMQPILQKLPDLEEQIVALLHGPRMEALPLRTEGLPPQIRRAAELLVRDGPFGEYLTSVRSNRISRNVLLALIDAEIGRTGEPLDSARRYLSGEADTYAPPSEEPVPAMDVYRQVSRQALEGRKIPHGISNPVLRSRKGRLCLAFFLYTYTRENLQNKAIPRPGMWIIADLRTGAILERISCRQEDFSSLPDGRLYSTVNSQPPLTNDDFHRLYALLDQVRRDILAGAGPDRQLYERYLTGILRGVPPEYHSFYRDLSRF